MADGVACYSEPLLGDSIACAIDLRLKVGLVHVGNYKDTGLGLVFQLVH